MAVHRKSMNGEGKTNIEEEKWESESNKSPLDCGPGSWLDAPQRLIKMEFLMLIFVFSRKGWHILERHTACIFNGKSLHIFSSTPHCLVLRVTATRCSNDSQWIAAHYFSLSAPDPALRPHTVNMYGSRFPLKVGKTTEQRPQSKQEQLLRKSKFPFQNETSACSLSNIIQWNRHVVLVLLQVKYTFHHHAHSTIEHNTQKKEAVWGLGVRGQHKPHHEHEILPGAPVADPDSDVRGLTMHLSRPHSQPQGASAPVGGCLDNMVHHTHAKPTHPNITTHPLTHSCTHAALSLTTNLLTTKGATALFCSCHWAITIIELKLKNK